MLEASSLLLTRDVAKVCDVSEQSVRAWERSGRLPAVRTVGNVRIFRGEDVLRFQQARVPLRETGGDRR